MIKLEYFSNMIGENFSLFYATSYSVVIVIGYRRITLF